LNSSLRKFYGCHHDFVTGFVTRLTRRVSLVEQELLTLPEHLCSLPVFIGVHVIRSVVLYVCFVDRCLSFCNYFLLAIVLSVLLRYTDFDYPFGIFKLVVLLNEGLLKNFISCNYLMLH
jgi:branched-subunit amino acid transport protein